jgi:hypothetical protein
VNEGCSPVQYKGAAGHAAALGRSVMDIFARATRFRGEEKQGLENATTTGRKKERSSKTKRSRLERTLRVDLIARQMDEG